jgi:large subunit ribosomal protein L19
MDMSSIIELKPNPHIPQISPGDTVRVSHKVREGDRERTQVFQGVVIRVRKGKASANFTVRRVTYGVGVECTIFFHSPLLEKIEVIQHGRVRRAKLYYLRGLSSRASRAKIKAKAKAKIIEEHPPEEQAPEEQQPEE